jgi:DNA-binding MarR family transcriptional regulator
MIKKFDEKEVTNLIYDIFTYVPTFYRTLFKVNEELLKGSGLLSAHLFLMFALKNSGESTTTELAKLLHVSKPNISVLVDKLVRRSLVERLPSAEDRRVHILRITERGNEFIEDHVETYIENIHQILDDLNEYTEEDYRGFIRTIESIKQHLAKKEEIQNRKN